LLRAANVRAEEIATRLRDTTPIASLVREGYDLETEILPVVRARFASGARPRSWRYFVAAVREARPVPSVPPRALGVPQTNHEVTSTIWIDQFDPLWQPLVDRWKTKHGKRPPTDKRGGWHFAESWVVALRSAP
jgi:hypothetical protein